MPTLLSSDFPVHFRADGDDRRPALLLINELGTTLDVWEPQLDTLTTSNWVVRFDIRGHGRSVGPVEPYGIGDLMADAVAILDSLEVPRAHVFGDSLGGLVGLLMAAEWPDRVDRLVLSSTAPLLGPERHWLGVVDDVNTSGLRSIAGQVETSRFSSAWIDLVPSAAEAARAMFLATPVDAYLAGVEAIRGADLRDAAANVRATTLLIAGENDELLSNHPVADLLDSIPDSEAVEVAGASHGLVVEQPDLVASVVSQFLVDADGR